VKIIIAAEDGDLIREVVEKADHAVVAETDDTAQLLALILQYEPHLVFVEKTEQSARDVERLQSVFKRVRFVLLGFQRGSNWTKSIRQALRQGSINSPWRPETPDERQIIFDLRYYALSSSTKLKSPGNHATSTEAAAVETLRLSRMLRAAKSVRDRAALYAKAKSSVDVYEWEEIAYRTVHSSFKAPAYARDQLARALGYLAHFAPGADLDGLPRPANEPAVLRFLHFEAPAEAHYALFCLAMFGCNSDLSKQLYRATHWRFEGESSEHLVETSLAITGLAFAVHLITLAHATTIDWLLDPTTVLRINDPRPRALHRALQTFTDWWGFRCVMDDTNRLGAILKDLQNNPEDSSLPDELKIPHFAQFLAAMKAAKETNPNQNPPPQ
jgi:hypothetical protein